MGRTVGGRLVALGRRVGVLRVLGGRVGDTSVGGSAV